MNRAEFLAAHPGVFLLDPQESASLEDFLAQAGVLLAGDSVVVAKKAGDGNMNCAVRVETGSGNRFIVKQARPWVEKYPQFAAPWDRALREIEFYELAGTCVELKAALPDVLYTDRENRLLVLEDLGDRSDCSSVYDGGSLSEGEVASLAGFLSTLHRRFQGTETAKQLENREMRELNHAHIFDIPFRDENGLDLDSILPGLERAATEMRNDTKLVASVRDLGATAYLASSATLGDQACIVHGDFFPGSFLRAASGIKIIDPEFCFGGRAEFDCGVFLAHLVLGRQSRKLAEVFLESYAPPLQHCESTVLRLAGVEIIRRLIGYAQLPLASKLEERLEMLRRARALVLEPDRTLLLR